MTWEQLCAKAKELGYYLCWNYNDKQALGSCNRENKLLFYSNGVVTCENSFISENRTPDQMLAIMEALR
jgi:hypothetical protein